MQDFYSGRIRGIAFLEFYDQRDAEDAKHSMDRMVINGREVGGGACRGQGGKVETRLAYTSVGLCGVTSVTRILIEFKWNNARKAG